MENRFPDIELTHENCEKEPIHRPGEIQSHGYIMVFKKDTPLQLHAMSENVPELFGKEPEELWGNTMDSWMPEDMHQWYVANFSRESAPPVLHTTVQIREQEFYAIVHRHLGNWFLELEPKMPLKPDYLQEILNFTNTIKSCESLEDLYETCPALLKDIIGYDRVMIYQFDENGHGEVIGEAKEPELETFLNLHYPATDVPQIARELFIKNKTRIISDTHASNHQLVFREDEVNSTPYLDMTYSQLRATSPIHIEYLVNMGVNATLSIALVQEGKLWGLFACHHYSERLISYELRRALQIISDVFLYSRSSLQMKEEKALAEDYRYEEKVFLEKINLEENISTQITDDQVILLKLCEADGVAAIAHEKSTFSTGFAPEKRDLIKLRNWMIKNGHDTVFSTSNFMNEVPIGAEFSLKIGGMMAICTSKLDDSYIFWFREPIREQISWGGNPNAPYEVASGNGDKEIRLSPRKSFEKWEMIVEDRALPWRPFEEDMAVRVREAILKKEFQRAAEKVEAMKSEFMELTFIASHDLLQPLRTLSNYMDLFYEEVEGVENKNIDYYISRTKLATGRMNHLIQDLLDYSRLGKSEEKTEVNINEVIREIQEDLQEAIQSTSATISVGEFPIIQGDPLEIKQLFQNLINNALKYVRPGIPPEIKLSAVHEGKYWMFEISDNGIGIEQKHFAKIFEMFQRLHSQEEYAGTGIGLALVKKIVQSYDGKIDLKSKVNEGTTFCIRIHQNNIV